MPATIIVRDMPIRETNAVQVNLTEFERLYWGIDWTRAGNLRLANIPAAQYLVARLLACPGTRGADKAAARIKAQIRIV